MTEELLTLILFISGFLFIAGGICIANSKEIPKSIENIILFISLLGIIGIFISIIGLIFLI